MKESSYVGAIKLGVFSQIVTRGSNYLLALVLLASYSIKDFGSIQYAYFQTLSISTVIGLSIRQSYSFKIAENGLMSAKSKYVFIVLCTFFSVIIMYIFPSLIKNRILIVFSPLLFASEYFNTLSFAELEGKRFFRQSSLAFSVLSLARLIFVYFFVGKSYEIIALSLFAPSFFLSVFFFFYLLPVNRGDKSFVHYVNIKYHTVFIFSTINTVIFKWLLSQEKGGDYFGYFSAIEYLKNIFVYLVGVASSSIVPYLDSKNLEQEKFSFGRFQIPLLPLIDNTILAAPILYFSSAVIVKLCFNIDALAYSHIALLSILLYLNLRGEWKVRNLLKVQLPSIVLIIVIGVLCTAWTLSIHFGLKALLAIVFVESIRVYSIEKVLK